MSLLELVVPFSDVRGDSLKWALGLQPREALASRELALGRDLRVDLRVLGASHQVLLRHGDDVRLSETVACDLAGAGGMPTGIEHPGYRFTSRVQRLSAAALRGRVSALVDELADRDDSIVAGFPALPDAVTALAVEYDATTVVWRSWHAYPQSSEVVHTRTAVDPAEVLR